MTTLLRDVIHIPERVGSDDYVLRLTDSTHDEDHIRATLDEYVLTESLRDNFFAAVDLVADALNKNTSRAAYLTGSFGSGKSHFMAVLYALLGNHPAMRTAKFQALTGRHDGELSGKKVLRLTYHLLGAKTLEQAILKGYVEQISQLPPDAPLPAVHVSDSLLDNAEGFRQQLGDEKFLAGLGGEQGDTGGWGGLVDSAWDLAHYEAARSAGPEDSERRELVSALVTNYFPSFTETADYVDLDRGLVVITEHAKALVDDGVVNWIKYAIVREDTANDEYLRELVDVVDPQQIVSGIGEQPAIVHLRDFGVQGFTSGCVCIAPSLSMKMLAALKTEDHATAETIRQTFEPLENLRNAINPIRVLHTALTEAGIANTGPILPLLHEVAENERGDIAAAAKELLAHN